MKLRNRLVAWSQESRSITLVTAAMIVGITTGRFDKSTWAPVFGFLAYVFFLFCAYIDSTERSRFKRLLDQAAAPRDNTGNNYFSLRLWVRDAREALGWESPDYWNDNNPQGPIQ